MPTTPEKIILSSFRFLIDLSLLCKSFRKHSEIVSAKTCHRTSCRVSEITTTAMKHIVEDKHLTNKKKKSASIGTGRNPSTSSSYSTYRSSQRGSTNSTGPSSSTSIYSIPPSYGRNPSSANRSHRPNRGASHTQQPRFYANLQNVAPHVKIETRPPSPRPKKSKKDRLFSLLKGGSKSRPGKRI